MSRRVLKFLLIAAFTSALAVSAPSPANAKVEARVSANQIYGIGTANWRWGKGEKLVNKVKFEVLEAALDRGHRYVRVQSFLAQVMDKPGIKLGRFGQIVTFKDDTPNYDRVTITLILPRDEQAARASFDAGEEDYIDALEQFNEIGRRLHGDDFVPRAAPAENPAPLETRRRW